jgi:predicted dehydrogenase
MVSFELAAPVVKSVEVTVAVQVSPSAPLASVTVTASSWEVSDADPVAGGFGEFQFRLRRGDLHVPRTDLTEPLALELDHFLACCRTGARPWTDGWNGVRVVATLEAAQQSLEEGGVQVEVEATKGLRR